MMPVSSVFSFSQNYNVVHISFIYILISRSCNISVCLPDVFLSQLSFSDILKVKALLNTSLKTFLPCFDTSRLASEMTVACRSNTLVVSIPQSSLSVLSTKTQNLYLLLASHNSPGNGEHTSAHDSPTHWWSRFHVLNRIRASRLAYGLIVWLLVHLSSPCAPSQENQPDLSQKRSLGLAERAK